MRKLIFRVVLLVLSVIILWFILRLIQDYKRQKEILPAKIEEIKSVVKLSSLGVTAEEIFKDTINGKGIVARVKANVYISFDVENMPSEMHGDTLFLQLPLEIVEVFESSNNGYEVYDVWNTQFPDELIEVALTTYEENLLKQTYKQRIIERMYEKGYVKKARENAMESLVSMFSLFQENVIIVNKYPNGYRQNAVEFKSLKDS